MGGNNMQKQQKIQIIKNIFVHTQPTLFVHYSTINSNLLLGIRVIAALYLSCFYVYDISMSHSPMDKLIYLTDIGYFFSWLYYITVLQAYFINIIYGLDKYVEIIFQTIYIYQVFITIAYWTVIEKTDNQPSLFKKINQHGVPLFFLLLDMIFNSYRFIPQQYVAALIFGFTYMFGINMPYSIMVQPVYGQASDWKGWQTYIFILAAIIVTAAVYACCRIIYLIFKQPIIQKNRNKNKLLTQNSKYSKTDSKADHHQQQIYN